jgi:hypothetical protein
MNHSLHPIPFPSLQLERNNFFSKKRVSAQITKLSDISKSDGTSFWKVRFVLFVDGMETKILVRRKRSIQ